MNVDDWPKTGWSDSTLRYQSGESLKVLDETQRPYQQKSNISTILQNMKAQ